jgi:hypothetical protein
LSRADEKRNSSRSRGRSIDLLVKEGPRDPWFCDVNEEEDPRSREGLELMARKDQPEADRGSVERFPSWTEQS